MVHKIALSLLLGSLPCLRTLATVGPSSIVGDPWASCRHDSANRAIGPRVAMSRRSTPSAADPLPNCVVVDPPLLAGSWMDVPPSVLETPRGKLTRAPKLARGGVRSRGPWCPDSGLLPAETPGNATLVQVAPSSSSLQDFPGRPSPDDLKIVETRDQAQTRWTRGPRERGGPTQKRALPGPPSFAPSYNQNYRILARLCGPNF